MCYTVSSLYTADTKQNASYRADFGLSNSTKIMGNGEVSLPSQVCGSPADQLTGIVCFLSCYLDPHGSGPVMIRTCTDHDPQVIVRVCTGLSAQRPGSVASLMLQLAYAHLHCR